MKTTLNINPQVIVVGGGVIGSAVTYYLSRAGVRVVLIEKKGLTSETSGACSGKVWLGTKKPGLHLELARMGLHMLKELRQEFDYPFEMDSECGEMYLIESERDLRFMEEFAAQQQAAGIEMHLLTKGEIGKLQPSINVDVLVGAAYSPSGIAINPISLVYAFVREAEGLGATILRNTPVEEICVEGSRVKSVSTDKGEIRTDFVVNAAGVAVPSIGKMIGIDIPIVPLRGEILVTEAVAPFVRIPIPTSEARYIVAKKDPQSFSQTDKSGVTCGVSQSLNGNVYVSASKEFAGHNKMNSTRAMKLLAQGAIKFFPKLESVRVIRSYAGLRPYTADGLPILGEIDGIEGFIMAGGHSGDGIALSAITGKLISEIITTGSPSVSIDKFRLSRFAPKNLQ
ncbi:MAG: FAD-binding oxidoreductase [Thermodesulfobacteriota bacterium]